MSSFEIVWGRPWLLLLMIPAAAIVLLPFLRIPARRRKNPKRIIPVILRMTVCLLLVFCLAGLTFIMQTDSQSVMILMDLSDSTAESHERIVSYANDLKNQLEGKCGVVAFAGDCVYEVEFDNREASAQLVEVIAADTNISAAMEYAASLLPNNSNRRIILISDGKETSGDAASAAFTLATQGYRIDAVHVESSYLNKSEIQISNVTMPDNIYAGDVIDIAVTVDSNVKTSAELILFSEDSCVSRLPVEVKEGENSFFVSTVVEKAGINTYRIELEAGSDTLLSNNRIYSYVKAAGESSVLVIADNPNRVMGNGAADLSAILDPFCELSVVDEKNAPNTIVELCNYDEIILINVNARDLPDGFAGNLASYVADFGRSVLTVGGSGTYMYGNMKGTLFEEMMPVELVLTEDQSEDTVALMLVLDTSASIRRHLPLAKQGAIQSINAMAARNYIGLISFNTNAHLSFPLVKATKKNKESLNRTISGFTTRLGTHYTEALELAHRELSKVDATIKHVIFLSDGDPKDTGYYEAARDMAEDGITVSTISVGYTSSILSELADIGNGRYYDVQTVQDLPNIMLSETEQSTVNSLLVGSFTPVINGKSDLTEGLEEVSLPSLGGYLGVTLKEDAEALIVSEEENPVYAVWKYKLGTVASFMSDLEGDWSSEWLSSETGRVLIERMMSTTISDIHSDSTVKAEFEKRGSKTSIVVECLAPSLNGSVAVEVSMPNGESVGYTLTEVITGIYEGEIDTPLTGIYEMKLVQYDAEGTTVDYLDTALAISYSTEYNAFGESGAGLLESVSSYSGGIVAENPAALAEVEMAKADVLKDPLIPIVIICAVLMLADLILRLLRWKDVKLIFVKAKSGKAKRM